VESGKKPPSSFKHGEERNKEARLPREGESREKKNIYQRQLGKKFTSTHHIPGGIKRRKAENHYRAVGGKRRGPTTAE